MRLMRQRCPAPVVTCINTRPREGGIRYLLHLRHALKVVCWGRAHHAADEYLHRNIAATA
jgi:hypothetical protein